MPASGGPPMVTLRPSRKSRADALPLPHTFQRICLYPMNKAVSDLSSHTPIVLGYVAVLAEESRVCWL